MTESAQASAPAQFAEARRLRRGGPLVARSAATLLWVACALSVGIVGGVVLGVAGESAAQSIEPAESADPPRDRPPWYFGQVKATTGFDLSSGNYGLEERTYTAWVPFSLRYSFQNFAITSYDWDEISIKVTLPVIWDKGPGCVIDGDVDASCPPDSLIQVREAAGIGDMSFLFDYTIFPKTRLLPVATASMRITAPTGDAKAGLGRGEAAYTLGVELSQSFPLGSSRAARRSPLRISPFIEGGYRWIGNLTTGNNDYGLLSAGLSLRVSTRFSFGVAYDFRGSPSINSEDRHEISPFVSIRVNRSLGIGPYATAGLSESSPDWAAGMTLSVRWDVR